jgi:hypothetical protein
LLLTVASQAVLASRTLFLVSLCLSKLSVLLVIRSLFSWEKKRKTLVTYVTIVVVALWGFAAALTLSVRCSSDYVLGGGEAKCFNHVGPSLYCRGFADSQQLVRLRAIMVVDIITESAIFVLVPIFLSRLNMATRKKYLVVIAFSSRLPWVLQPLVHCSC